MICGHISNSLVRTAKRNNCEPAAAGNTGVVAWVVNSVSKRLCEALSPSEPSNLSEADVFLKHVYGPEVYRTNQDPAWPPNLVCCWSHFAIMPTQMSKTIKRDDTLVLQYLRQ